jgi:23S rRNA (cytidine2498-2'-O)-methyltransferase
MDVLLVKPGAEEFAKNDCKRRNIEVNLIDRGILTGQLNTTDNGSDECFPFWICYNTIEIDLKKSTNSVETVCNWFCDEIKDERFEEKWPLTWLTSSENGFTPDLSKAERIKEKLKKRISRIIKLADTSFPQTGKKVKGLFTIESKTSEKLFISREAIFFGQRRMKDDPLAPSRSYLKIEEAFTIFDHCPKTGETVVDLGAAPGGWTWAALKRGATVYAIDNGPLKNGPLNHPNVQHIREDAFTWRPTNIEVDWLFCDMVEQPQKVFDTIKLWFKNGWCKFAIVNFKYGYSDPGAVLELLYNRKGLVPYSKKMIIRHLFHDRDEITVMSKIQ